MELPDLKHDYYDARIREARLGPRRELNLLLQLRNHEQRGEAQDVAIRFGGITNFDEVRMFFGAFEQSPSRWAGLHFLRYEIGRASKPGALHLEMQFDGTGDEVRIACQSVAVSD